MIASESRLAIEEERWRRAQQTTGEAVVEKCGELQDMAVTWIRQYPAYAVGIAAAVGVTLGWLLKRR